MLSDVKVGPRFRRDGRDTERMDSTTHQFPEGVMDESVTRQGGFAGEGRRNDAQAVMPAALGAGRLRS